MAGLRANRSFYGWQHRFVWNRELLAAAMEAAGFEELGWWRYGESDDPPFRGLETHDKSTSTATSYLMS